MINESQQGKGFVANLECLNILYHSCSSRDSCLSWGRTIAGPTWPHCSVHPVSTGTLSIMGCQHQALSPQALTRCMSEQLPAPECLSLLTPSHGITLIAICGRYTCRI